MAIFRSLDKEYEYRVAHVGKPDLRYQINDE